MSHKLLAGPRISANYSSSADTTNTISDPSASSFKLSLSIPVFQDSNLRLGLRTIDDMYNFKGTGFDCKYTFPIYQRTDTEENNLQTKMYARLDLSRRYYSSNAEEAYSNLNLSTGLEHEWTSEFSVSADLSISTFSSQGRELQRSLSGQTSTNTNIQSTVEGLTFLSPSVGAEYSWNRKSIGLSVSRSIPKLSTQSSSTNTEIFFGFPIGDLVSVDLSFSRGRTEGSPTVSDSFGFGFGLSPN